jgi:peptidoglycan/LPS O-acetylase OafA/YrhL
MLWLRRPLTALLQPSAAPSPDAVVPTPARGQTFPLVPADLPRGHLPALDALRGLAILLVLIYRFGGGDGAAPGHGVSDIRWIELGARGVDLFFVLSGFLITGILHDSRPKPHYFRNFYIRRALRIFPLYYASLFVLLSGWLPLPPPLTESLRPAREHAAWLLGYGANLLQAKQDAWCLGATNHFWSLAIEEHFYLVWPAVIWGLSPAAACRLCLLLVVASSLGRAVWLASGGGEVAAFVLTPFRLDGLALGGWLALVARQPGGLAWLSRWAWPAVAGAGSLAIACELSQRRLLYLTLTVWSVAFAGLLVLMVTAQPRGVVGSLARSRVLQWLGRYSYGIYVFQLPLLYALANVVTAPGLVAWTGHPWAGQLLYAALMTAANLALAYTSWHLLEKRVLAWKRWFGG